MNNIYIQREAKKGFRNWTKQGLEFLLSLTNENRRMKYKIKNLVQAN